MKLFLILYFMARDVGAAPTYPGLEPGAFADMLIPNM